MQKNEKKNEKNDEKKKRVFSSKHSEQGVFVHLLKGGNNSIYAKLSNHIHEQGNLKTLALAISE